MDIETANKIMADKCGVKTETNDEYPELDNSLYYQDSKGFEYVWTIEDARCREIVREKFEIETVKAHYIDDIEYWWACSKLDDEGGGATIKEAEISCILAICEEISDE